MLEAFPDDGDGNTEYNLAPMVLISKKTPQERHGVTYHAPGDVQPLSVVNTDNRLVAKAYRLRIEPLSGCGYLWHPAWIFTWQKYVAKRPGGRRTHALG
jgi:hypothetical protein